MKTTTLRSRALGVALSVALAVTATITSAPPALGAPIPKIEQLPSVDGSTSAKLVERQLAKKAKTSPVPKRTFEYGSSFDVALKAPLATAGAPTGGSSATPNGGSSATPDGSAVATKISEWVPVGSTGISVADGLAAGTRLKAPQVKTSPAGSVSVSLPNPSKYDKHGARGIVVKIDRSTAGTSALSVKIPDSVLRGLYGADFDSRVRWVRVDGDSAKAVSAAEDAKGSTVLSTWASGRTVTFAALATTTSTSGTGNYAATPLNPASGWDVSAQTGGFAWTYPLPVSAPAAGPMPSLALGYQSQAVDGLTSATNNQSSPAGLGWSIGGSGFIERQYLACSEADGTGAAHTTSGDLCWKEDNATISFGDHSGQLVKVAGTDKWKFANDDGSTIHHATGSAEGCTSHSVGNGTKANDCWIVTTTDGTKYFFGLNVLPNSGNGTASQTKSVWTVPVYGDDAGEPCYNANFELAFCDQAWRWNLDYVVDAHGNAESYYYNAETNKYRKFNKTAVTYTRGGSLKRIDYGFRDGNAYVANSPSNKVFLNYDPYGRCVNYQDDPATTTVNETTANCTAQAAAGSATKPTKPTKYPDVPFDQLCTGTECTGMVSPSFWSTARLATVKTQSRTAATTYSDVDAWTFTHTFPDPGDGTTAMWLSSITHSGTAGTTTITEPPTTFRPVSKHNRLNINDDGKSYVSAMRIQNVDLPSGGVVSVTYSPESCSEADGTAVLANPQSNKKLCYPQWWTPQVVPAIVEPTKDIFHKYVVTSYVVDPRTGAGADSVLTTRYEYGDAAWRYNTSRYTLSKYKTWSEYAGFDKVEIIGGSDANPEAQTDTVHYFFQGMNGDRANTAGDKRTVNIDVPGAETTVRDQLWFAGQTRYTEVYNGAHATHQLVSRTLNTPWASRVITDNLGHESRALGNGSTVTHEKTLTGERSVTTNVFHDDSAGNPLYWLPTSQETIHSEGVDTCETYKYATSSELFKGLPSRVTAVAAPCGTAVTFPQDAISDTKIYYDGNATNGAASTRGLVTKTDTVASYSGTTADTAQWITTMTAAFDALGRTTATTDVLNREVKTAYLPAASGPLAQTTITSQVSAARPAGWVSKTFHEPTRGLVTSSEDKNAALTTITYDALGRRTGVWLPDRPKGTINPQPSIGYAYTQSNTAPNSIATSTAGPVGITTSFDIYDGLNRPIQKQAPADGVGSIIATTRYDALGRTIGGDNPYWTASKNPSSALFVPVSQSAIPSWTKQSYDGLGRPLTSSLHSYADPISSSSTSYSGADKTSVTPPDGGTPTTTLTNGRGQLVKLSQHVGTTTAASTVDTSYEYDKRGNLIRTVDAAGNEWTWKYNLLGHQIESSNPDSGVTTSTYDLAGNVVTTTDARNVTLTRKVDKSDRLLELWDGPLNTGKILAKWEYDTKKLGELTSSTSYDGSTPGSPGAAYKQEVTGYDAMNRVLGTTMTMPASAPILAGQSLTTTMKYNKAGLVSQVTYPAVGGLPAETLTYDYQSTGEQIALSGGGLFVSATYTPTGLLSSIDRTGSNAVKSNFGYNFATNAVDTIQHAHKTGAGTTLLTESLYERNDSGNITSISTSSASVDTDTQCFDYTYLGALKEAWTPADDDCSVAASSAALGGPAPYWQSFDIDSVTGNREAITRHGVHGAATTTDTYSYPAAGADRPHAVQQIERVGGTDAGVDTFAYNAIGATTERDGQTLSYDAMGRVSTITKNGAEQSRIYDPSGGLLLQKDPTEGTTLYLFGMHVNQAHGSQTVTASREYTLAGVPIAERNTKAGVTGNTLSWVCTNDQNTPLLQVDAATGAKTQRYVDPFGDKRGANSSWSSSRSFLDKPESVFSGLVQLGARLYDRGIGRFISVDAVMDPLNPQQNSAYAYSWNSPISNSDPTGNEPWPWHYNNGANQPSKSSSSTNASSSGYSAPSTAGNTKSTPAKKDTPKKEEWWNPFTWSGDTWQEVGANVAGIAVGVAITAAAGLCIAATAGACAAVIIGAAVVGGAAGAATTYALQPGEKTAEGFLATTLMGGAFGLIPGAGQFIGKAVSKVASAGLSKVGGNSAQALTKTAERAKDLQSAVPASSQGRITMGVGTGRDASGNLRQVVGTSERKGYLRKGVTLESGEDLARGPGHAETSILDFMKDNGITPLNVGAGRPICPACAEAIEEAGATAATPLKIVR